MTASNPYAPSPIAKPVERGPSVEWFCRRLAACGATRDEIEAVRDGWDDFDEDWTPQRQREVRYWSDNRIRAELAAARAEDDVHTYTEQEQELVDLGELRGQLREEASQVMDRRVDLVLEWVGTDQLRAEVVRDLETGSPAPRSTLLAALPQLPLRDE